MTAGIYAHVDAGKTTLTEALLYLTGATRSAGRVDKGDTHLDTDEIERERGITIFAAQARIRTEGMELTLLDTPGHADFAAETERTLQILDFAVLVISGTDGVQPHTRTIWRLLAHYGVPVMLFINKMDLPGADRARVLREIKEKLAPECVDFSLPQDELQEEIALSGEELLEAHLEGGAIPEEKIAAAVAGRRLFPVWSGSALRMENLQDLLKGMEALGTPRFTGQEGPFGAKVYKVSRDRDGRRLTHIRVTSGVLTPRMTVSYRLPDGSEREEKTDQIRLYSGASFEQTDRAEAGCVCSVTGLSGTRAGFGLGEEKLETVPVLTPSMRRSLILPAGVHPADFYRRLRELEEEEPLLRTEWNAKRGVIDVRIMGDVQTEVLTRLIEDRFGVRVSFDEPRVIYRETLGAPVEGVGHFEPLRHYAEVHLLMEPGARDSGIEAVSALGTDELDLNWQRLILSHVLEREYPGVLTGSSLTDVRVTLVAGRAHLKHTEGGDFRQAVTRAIRQGLMSAPSVLLEPVCSFELLLPADCVGRALTDLSNMEADFGEPVYEGSGDIARIEGSVPAAAAWTYPAQVSSYTRGEGSLTLVPGGYRACRNPEPVIEAFGYDPDADTENPSGSVFCAHGAGYTVPWNEVPSLMHLPYASDWEQGEDEEDTEADTEDGGRAVRAPGSGRSEMEGAQAASGEDAELLAIYRREFGLDERGMNRDHDRAQRRRYAKKQPEEKPFRQKYDQRGNPIYPKKDKRPEHLIVDGYNVIFAWPELRALAEGGIDAARGRLLDILSNYQGYLGYPVTVVFDAWRTGRQERTAGQWQNLTVIFTRENETADACIERKVHDESGKYRFTVATSDALEQLTVMRLGALRLPASALKEEIERVSREAGPG